MNNLVSLQVLSYNNYFNRLVKTEASLADYQPYVIYQLDQVNFNPNDFVNTEHLIGNGEYPGTGDYLLAIQNNEIISRWFIIEAQRTRGGQFKLSLRRDVVADYYNLIMEAPMFIEKALISEGDSAIVNSENITVNQIKTKEIPIKDNTLLSWLVAYIARQDEQGTTSIDGQVIVSGEADNTTELTQQDWLNYYGGSSISSSINNINFWAQFTKIVDTQTNKRDYLLVDLFKQNEGTGIVSASYSKSGNTRPGVLQTTVGSWTGLQFDSTYKSTFNEVVNTSIDQANLNNRQSLSSLNKILSYNNTTIKFREDDQKYLIQITETNKSYSSNYTRPPISGDSRIIYDKLRELWPQAVVYDDPNNAFQAGCFFNFTFDYIEYTINLTPVGTATTLNYNIGANRAHLTDAPYDMICAPYEDVTFVDGQDDYYHQKSADTLQVFNDIALKFAGNNGVVYDIQRLPYCPIQSVDMENSEEWNEIHIQFMDDVQKHPITNNNDERVGYIFSCYKSNISKYIPLKEPIAINNAKMQGVCDTYRLCSPNYSGIFEFDPVMNGGLEGFNVYCTYKPYNPYIQVSPKFGRLYGSDYKDSRGLICGGEFSMPIITSAWETYERQNKNYQAIFDRQIQNLQIKHEAAKTMDWVKAITGTLGGTVSGGYLGNALTGGTGLGIGLGMAGGGVASLAGGIADALLNQGLRREERSYAEDIHNLQLGNIQALPNSLARTSAFTVNNKIFPFLEYYTCTQEEKEAVANYIIYNSMTLGRVGLLSNYSNNVWEYEGRTAKNFVKGQLIRFDDLGEDTHIVNAIAGELSKGVYLNV